MPSQADPVAGAVVNVLGTLNVFEAARAIGAEKVVYASSAAVFGRSEDDVSVDETLLAMATHLKVSSVPTKRSCLFLDSRSQQHRLRPLTVYGMNRDSGLTSDPRKREGCRTWCPIPYTFW